MLKIIIIEDEMQAKNALEMMLSDLGHSISGYAQDVDQGFSIIQKIKPDVLFLDIELIGGTAFDILDKLDKVDFHIIFTTAYDHFAVKAFRYNALDYLLKPLEANLLKEALSKVTIDENKSDLDQQVKMLLESMKSQKFDRILLNAQDGISIIQKQNITRLEADGNYTTIYTNNGFKHIASNNLKYFEDMLTELPFFRIHQSHIVNIDFVVKVLKEDGGYVVLEDGYRVPIARRRKEEFLSILTHLK
jgi:two-component system LytT family response regulator